MIEQVTNEQALTAAFQAVKRNRGCGGVDEVSIARYERNLTRNIVELSRTLRTGRYAPLPVRRVLIPKPNGATRPLGIPAVRDRIVQQAILTVVQPLAEPAFSDCSYGFRPHRSALQAVRRVQEYLDQGYVYIVDADIKDFFGTLHHQVLMDRARNAIPDRRLTRLIWQFLNAGVMEEGKVRNAGTGTPQGGVISPLLANLYLNEFDGKLARIDWKLVRYADDFVILCKSVNAAVQALRTAREVLRSLHLELAEEKTRIAEYPAGFDFLGYRFQQYYGNYKWPRRKAVDTFKDKVRRLTRRQQPKNVKMVIEKLNPVIRGWGHYFKYGNVKKRFAELDGWVRMRLRSFIDKQKRTTGNWRYPNVHFHKLGLCSLTDLLAYQPTLSLP
jgi:group II intron reverse transcriptase/maturase